MRSTMTSRAEIITKPKEKLLRKSQVKLAKEPKMKLVMKQKTGQTMELEIKPAKTKKSLVSKISITILNISLSGLHDLIKTSNNKK